MRVVRLAEARAVADDEVEPRLGRIRSPPSRRGRRYLAQVLRSALRAGNIGGRQGKRVHCGRVGRGAGIGRLLGARGRLAGFRTRRAIVKTRLVRLRGKGLGAARAHLRYIQRDGVSRDGSRGLLYSSGDGEADGKAFIERCHGDRHQFRLIVSAEDACEYDDLRPLIRRLMARMEQDLGTRLEWVAVDHRDTAQPHTHIILRGRDETGENLIIARDYISSGMRERLAGLVTLDLGPRQDRDIRRTLRREMSAERLTSIDRALVRGMNSGGIVSAGHRDPFRHALRAGRLRKLEGLGLAEALGGGKWRMAEGVEDRLRRLGERGDIVRIMQRELTALGIDRPPADRIIHGDSPGPASGIVGRVIARGLADEMADRHYLIVDGVDGRVHHVGIGRGDAVEPLPEGAIVRVGPRASVSPSVPVRVELLSPLPLEALPARDGATWLDRELAREEPEPLRDAGFGREVRSALALRRRWLLERGFADEAGGRFSVRPGGLAVLRQRELSAAAAQLSGELGLDFNPAADGERIEGTLRRRVDLASGRFALVENGRDFSLLPWRPALERSVGRQITGVLRRGGVSWTIGRGRAGPEIE